MEFLLDTNAYRNLVKGLTMEEVRKLALKIKKKEADKGHHAGFPIVVAMELISHLVESDLDLHECYKALCLLVDHTKNYDAVKRKYTGTLYPPLNVILPKYFFNEDGEYLDLYKVIIKLAHDITEDYNVNNIETFKKEIKTVKDQLYFEKKEIRDNFESYIKSINKDIPDWEYFKKNRIERREWFKNIQNGKFTFLVSEGFMLRAYSITKRDYKRSDKNFEILAEFYNKFYPALVMNELLLTQLGHGTGSLESVEDEKWNTITDIHIMFAILFNPKSEEKTLVTNDDEILKRFTESDLGNKVMKLEDFKEILEI
ncbi:hypothetical protein [Flavobacterium suncheonense]|uniref:Uncharacterized protein n=1 Tax=Flavobacterium suncheonense GH29-5 = DSM 17707 TaxID=1121899 RepID=A0A0A2MC28_9FLAO|nr:hypothetical protein [Flavobacterium suncheonense]KGO85850.1 hypothetical protein Q764_13885 [Flavobacterium suncheonense GH29-5 = DSM 17707]